MSLMLSEEYTPQCWGEGVLEKQTNEEAVGKLHIGHFLAGFAQNQGSFAADLAAFGPKLSLEKARRDRRGGKLLALSTEKPPG